MKLFEDDWGEDNSPIEEVNITTTYLYYSEEELKEFKKLCKAGMKIEFGEQAIDSNQSDLLLTVLRKKYGESI